MAKLKKIVLSQRDDGMWEAVTKLSSSLHIASTPDAAAKSANEDLDDFAEFESHLEGTCDESKCKRCLVGDYPAKRGCQPRRK